MYELEKCEEKDSKEREKYWIEKLNAVNKNKLNMNRFESNAKYYEKNKEELRRKARERMKLNTEKQKLYMREYRKKK